MQDGCKVGTRGILREWLGKIGFWHNEIVYIKQTDWLWWGGEPYPNKVCHRKSQSIKLQGNASGTERSMREASL